MAGEGLLAAVLKVAAGVAVGLPLVLYFAQDGARLHGWWVRPPSHAALPLVLYFGGNAEEVSWMLEVIGDARRSATPGVAWLLVNYRGYGASEGAPSERALVADAQALYDYALQLPGIDARRVYAFGRSLGSGVAVALAAERTLRGVVLVSPFDSLTAVAKHYYPYLPVGWMLKHRFDSLERAPSLSTPLLCLIADRDEIIPPQHGIRLYEAWGGTKRRVMLSGARHNETDAVPQFWPEIRAFLAQAGQ